MYIKGQLRYLNHYIHKTDILVVVDVNDFGDGKTYKHKGKILSPYVYGKDVLYKLKHTEIPYVFAEDDEDKKYKTHRFHLKCKTSDLKYIPLLKAVCNYDLGIQPNIFHRVYFLNIKQKSTMIEGVIYLLRHLSLSETFITNIMNGY